MDASDTQIAILMALIPATLIGIWIGYLLRIRWVIGVAVSVAITVGCAVCLSIAHDSMPTEPGLGQSLHNRLRSDERMPLAASIVVFANLGIALLAKLYRAAVLRKATLAECNTGIAGVRAWLAPMNVISVICFAVAAGFGFDCSYLGMTILGLCLLLAYPLINTLMQQPTQIAAPPQAAAEERQRVLALVEAGKITAEEGAELLSALAQSQVAGIDAGASITGPRKLLVVGAGVVLISFFLPWFTINITQAMHDAMNSVQQNMSQFSGMPAGMQMNVNTVPGAVPNVTNVMSTTLHGGDVRNGMGWIALATGLCAAGMPFFLGGPGGSITQQHRGFILILLAAGSVAVLYLLSSSLNSVTSIEPGFILAITGYAVLWVGAIREYLGNRTGVPVGIAAAV